MNLLPGKTYYTFILTVVVILIYSFSSCKKDNSDDIIPYVPVNTTIYLSLPEYAPLNSIGNSVFIDGGYRGIVVYRRALTEFVAYDRACPFDPTASGAKLVLDSGLIITVDLNCGSKFSLFDGSILHGPSTRPMKPYNTNYDPGSNSVTIYN